MRTRALGLLVGLSAMIQPSGRAGAADTPMPTTEEGTLRFRNDVGPRFELVEARFSLDGVDLPTVLTHVDRGRDYVLYSAKLSSGHHVVSTHLVYRSKGRRVFTYVNSYRFNVRSEEVLTALPDGSATFTIVGREKKGITVPVEKALQVDVETNIAPPPPPDVAIAEPAAGPRM